MPAPKVIFELRQVSKIYELGDNKVYALNKATMSVYQGEFLAIIGPSGSGKSTLMHILGLMDQPSSGEIALDGKTLAKLSDTELARLRGKSIGFIFQAFNLLPRLNALENVILPLQYQNISKREKIRLGLESLEAVDLADRAGHLPSELSGGQRQRVAIARALVSSPKLILADEPTGNLDSKNAEEILKIFENLHKNGVTFALVTHEEKIAARASRRIRIFDGKVEEETYQN